MTVVATIGTTDATITDAGTMTGTLGTGEWTTCIHPQSTYKIKVDLKNSRNFGYAEPIPIIIPSY